MICVSPFSAPLDKASFPLTLLLLLQERYLRRARGSYGPAIKAGEGMFPGPAMPISGLYCVGDSTFPGIGLPAVAASGAICANTLASVQQHKSLLAELGI